jgi:5'-nucleotidase/UDP-sugar diphosphatase
MNRKIRGCCLCLLALILYALSLAACDDIPEPDPVDPEFGTNRFDSRKRETALGGMICDGIVWSFNQNPPDGRQADFGVLNGGIFEFGLPKRPITGAMIPGMLKGDILTYVDMEGRDVKLFFEELAGIAIGANAWAQVSKEVRFTINWTNGMGQVRELEIGGQQVDDDTRYRMVTGHVLVWGKPNSHIDRYYETLHRLEVADPDCAVKMGEKTCTEAIAGYVNSRPRPYIPEIDGRIVIEK